MFAEATLDNVKAGLSELLYISKRAYLYSCLMWGRIEVGGISSGRNAFSQYSEDVISEESSLINFIRSIYSAS
jgi:hypothetical protein